MEEPQQEPGKEVIKHSAAIQIENNITLLQRRAWNVLLYNAYDGLRTEEVHHIRVRELMEILEFGSKNEAYLKEALEALVSCKVKWNLLDKDGDMEWGVAALLAEARIKRGICTYAYGPTLRERLHSPRMYARLSLSLQNRFESKHAQALWELCADYLGAGREYGETAFIAIEQVRKLVGLENSHYAQQFKILNRDVLKPALAEINRVSDLRVTVEQQRQGRKVVALKFKIRRVVMLPATRQADLFSEQEDTPVVVKLLKDAGLASRDAWEVWQEGFDYVEKTTCPEMGDNPEDAFVQYVNEKIHLLAQRQQAGKVSNPAGFLLTAIKKNYGNARLEQEQKGRARKREAQELRGLQEQRNRLTCERDDTLQEVSDQIIATLPDLLQEAVTALQQQNDAMLSRYDARRSPLENYRERPSVAIGVGNWLQHRFPERFARTTKPFDEELAALDARISAIEGKHLQVAATR